MYLLPLINYKIMYSTCSRSLLTFLPCFLLYSNLVFYFKAAYSTAFFFLSRQTASISAP